MRAFNGTARVLGVCTLKSKRWRQCCCNCKALVQIRRMPAVKGDTFKVVGYGCAIFAHEGTIYDNWTLHGIGCEGYMPKDAPGKPPF